ncbi:transcription factor RcaD [Aphanothece hegewaldii CCALA 016]|uniref:Transcription factor RcaD n=1 Tax=Aphanothece hegewaldii CCALA 016 TaxID=2107694 RepID=A0A2T1LS80_9CHRO|nr:transcription factor RcaD [Aphanothece hegewaldii]PSF32474.1 transcription factor RcaD [Aphanothece hegewaldii CCALA 016]
MNIDCLNFLLRLYESNHHRVYLAKWSKFKGKNQICEQLGERGLVDFTREIATVKITPAGQGLLELNTVNLLISEIEYKVLKKIAKFSEITPSKLLGKSLKAADCQSIINSFCEKGLISTTTKKKRNHCEVWLTQKGLECIQQVNDYFLNWENSFTKVPKKPKEKPTDEAILQMIIQLDQELGTNNYLPIFHLRKALQPPLSRSELDQAIYRLQGKDKIEVSTLAEVKAYSIEEIDTGIPQPVGGPLFFIIVN